MRRRTKILLWALAVLLLFSLYAAWRIHTWGRPVPLAYQRVGVTPAHPGGDRSWTYRRQSNGRRYVANDSDGNGTVDSVSIEGSQLQSFLPPQANDPQSRWLVVCLDGVPYEVMLSLWEEGYFREFSRPAPLIAPFPSESEVALTEAFQSGPVPGYEHRYFDRQRNRLGGGVFATLSEANIPYLELLDYDMGGLFKGLAYVLPRKSYRADLGRFRQRFLASDQKIYLAHLASSDSLYHIIPRDQMRQLLTEVDSLLRELYYDAAGTLRITLFADHGNSLAESQSVPLAEHLETSGWRLTNRLAEEQDVVVPAYGLVGFLAVYVAEGKAPQLAPVLAELPGSDLVVYREDGGAAIESSRGRAWLEWSESGDAFRYQRETGDPLLLAPVLDRLRETGKTDSEGWVSDADLFRATMEHPYPDAAHRIRGWATNHVRNPSDLMVSLKPGYFFGSGVFQHVVDILSTHGSMDRMQSLGFAMSTAEPLAHPIRGSDLLPADIASLKNASRTDPR